MAAGSELWTIAAFVAICLLLLLGQRTVSIGTEATRCDFPKTTFGFEPGEEEAKQIAEQEALKGNAKYIFHHIHKSGGSTICTFAHNIGLKGSDDNCNLGQVDGQEKFIRMPLRKQKDLIRKLGYDLVALEYVGVPEHGWYDSYLPQMVYFTMLRHPLSRLLSQYKHDCDVWYCPRANETVNRNDKDHSLFSYLQDIARLRGKLVPLLKLDNLAVRQLAGYEAMYLTPVGELTYTHFQAAIAALDKYSAVLILEDLENTAPQLVEKFGWKNANQLSDIHSNSRGESEAFEELKDDPESFRLLHELNSWDLLLYDYAKRKFCPKCKVFSIDD